MRINGKKIYHILIAEIIALPSSQQYYKILFRDADLDWKNMYILPRIVSLEIKVSNFQYKLINNILYLRKMLFKFGKIGSSLCCFSKTTDETPIHSFCEFHITNQLQNQLKFPLNTSLTFHH